MRMPVAIAALAVLFASAVAVPHAKADLKEILDKGRDPHRHADGQPALRLSRCAGKPTGFDIELGQMIGKALGVKVEVEQIIGANRIPFLLTNKIDLVISGMGATPERAVQVDVHLALRRALSRRLRAEGQGGDRPRHARHAEDGGDQGHDAGDDADGDGAEGEHRALRGRHDLEHRLPVGPDRSLGDAQHRSPDRSSSSTRRRTSS